MMWDRSTKVNNIKGYDKCVLDGLFGEVVEEIQIVPYNDGYVFEYKFEEYGNEIPQFMCFAF